VNGSKYTFGEVRYLGYFLILLGIINLWMPGNGLLSGHWDLAYFIIIYGMVIGGSMSAGQFNFNNSGIKRQAQQKVNNLLTQLNRCFESRQDMRIRLSILIKFSTAVSSWAL